MIARRPDVAPTPSHAIAHGRDGQAMRMRARQRRLLSAWQHLPMLVLLITSVQVAGGDEPIHGGTASQVSHIIQVALLAGLFAAAGSLALALAGRAITALASRLGAGTGSPAAPRSRWHYVLAAAGWLVIATCFALLSLRAGTGLATRLSTAAGVWCGLYGLVLIGRAATWGRLRALLWWSPIGRRRRPSRTL